MNIKALVSILLACNLYGCVLPINTQKAYQKAAEGEPLDVVIVPGLPYDTADMPGLMMPRLHWAKLLYDSGIAKHIIFSGSSVYTPYKEGLVMKIMADSIGIPSYRTFAETTAEHSTENLYFSWKMAREMGFRRIGLATDPFQMLLLKRYRRKFCKDVQLIPVNFKMLNWDEISLPKINPDTAFVSDFVSLTERETFWERARATLGKRVREDIKAENAKAVNEHTQTGSVSYPRKQKVHKR